MAVEFVLAQEGVIYDDPRDSGGLTKWGISALVYPQVSSPEFTREDAIQIYRSNYWNRCSCDQFPPGLALLLFDSAVNQGPAAAIRMMQKSIGAKADGVIGPDTLAKASAALSSAMAEMAARRLYAYGMVPTFTVFGLGWCRRTCACLKLALAF